jgi:hypothetical protein
MQPAAATSSFSYAVFTFAVDDAGAVNVPVGVALWSSQQRWAKIRLVATDEHLQRFNAEEHYPYVALVRDKIHQWIQSGSVPYGPAALAPYETQWWKQAREVLVHRLRLSEPRPIDCIDPEQEIEPLYEAVVSPHRAAREQQARVDGEIGRCLDDLAKKFKPKRELAGYGGRSVRVLRSFDGPVSTVVIEGVNLATNQAEQQSDAVVSKLLRLQEGTSKRLEVIVGYLTSPGGLNGEGVLVEWIQHKTGAKAFDLLRERQQFRQEAGNLVASAACPISR